MQQGDPALHKHCSGFLGKPRKLKIEVLPYLTSPFPPPETFVLLTELMLHFGVHHGLVSPLDPQNTTTEAFSPEPIICNFFLYSYKDPH